MSTHIAVLVGSTRTGSVNQALYATLKELQPEGVVMEQLDITTLPMFNGDIEKNAFPPEVQKIKDTLKAADGIILITPEYNRSTTPLLKNAIDWVSRPWGDNTWAGKKVGVMGATGGSIGTSAAQLHVKQMLDYLAVHTMHQPEFYLSHVTPMIVDGKITDQNTREHITKYLAAFLEHIKH